MVYVFLANGFEEVEALTVVDYLRRCEELNVQTVGVNSKMVTGSHGITILADTSISDIDLKQADMIVLPGGMPGTINLEKSQQVNHAINYCMTNQKYIAAICAAPSILGHMGILNGKNACCYIGFEEQLKGAVISKNNVEVCDNIITSRGAGTANQFSFALVEILCGKNRADLLKDAVLWQE